MPSPATESLRIANENLRAGLAGLLPESNASASLTPKDLSGLLTALLQARESFRSVVSKSPPDSELENAISEYRRTVEQLALVLPRIHSELLTKKARLEIARAHLTATAAWAKASQNTL
jgi:hypothetical protein